MINQYIVARTLGKGSFSTVKLCTDKNTGTKYAIKQMNKKMLKKKNAGKGRNAYDCVLDELRVLKQLEHPNIIWLHEIIDDPSKDIIYFVTEYHSRGSLGDQLNQKNKRYENFNKKANIDKQIFVGLNEKTVRLYFIDMLKAVFYCHKVIKVIHRDIKPDNIMINHNNEAVLIDFGVSALVGQEEEKEQANLNSALGSYLFFAPEMFSTSKEKKIQGEKTDIWALGVTLYQLLSGRYPA